MVLYNLCKTSNNIVKLNQFSNNLRVNFSYITVSEQERTGYPIFCNKITLSTQWSILFLKTFLFPKNLGIGSPKKTLMLFFGKSQQGSKNGNLLISGFWKMLGLKNFCYFRKSSICSKICLNNLKPKIAVLDLFPKNYLC